MRLRRHGNTQAVFVTIGEAELCFSYGTLVGFRDGVGGVVATSQSYSTSTSRHMGSIFFLKNAEKVSQEELERRAINVIRGGTE